MRKAVGPLAAGDRKGGCRIGASDMAVLDRRLDCVRHHVAVWSVKLDWFVANVESPGPPVFAWHLALVFQLTAGGHRVGRLPGRGHDIGAPQTFATGCCR